MSASTGPLLDFRNTNTLWCSVLVETLARCGVRHAVISPGSRSTALTIALVRHSQIETIPVLDERSAGFFALGLAKQHHRPTVLVCTSGTAGANYFPAIIEAQESGAPLLVITADRPPEMRECASGQTIDQQRLFGSHVNWCHELALPEATMDRLRYLRQTVAHAHARATAPGAGPVHLNAPFRDPLPPLADQSALEVEGMLGDAFFSHLGKPPPPADPVRWTPPPTARGLIVAGPDTPRDADVYADRVMELAQLLGWPVLADALSPLRHYAEKADLLVTAYDAILRSEAAARMLKPDFVLCLGGWPTSKALRSWLEQSEAEITLVSRSVANRDALHGRTRQMNVLVELLALAPGKGVSAAGSGVYAELWRQAEIAAREILDSALGAEDALFEPKAAWLMSRHLPTDTPVFVASSMPVRDVEHVWPANTRWFQFFFNRGANGIDGTLASALGVAHGNRPAVLLTGDLALLHDTNGFLLAAKLRGSLTIVLINNRGGGIFQHLPVAQFEPPFEEYFATPQKVDFGPLCAAYGVEHISVRDWAHFVALISALPQAGVRVLEIATDRRHDAVARKKLFADAAESAGAVL
jgi:2-succinyl-5-enolpyruvyl-6-hydroxy-3-cyclohexene-1-carboxylate synthase